MLRNTVFTASLVACFGLLVGCADDLPLTAERYLGSDKLFAQLEDNIAANPDWGKVAEIDHSRLGSEAGSSMPPARVLLFSNPALEVALLQLNPLVGIDLPLRVLAFEQDPGGESKVAYSSYDYLESRYNLPSRPALRSNYNNSMSTATIGIPASSIGEFVASSMEGDGVVTIDSPYDFKETLQRVQEAIAAQDDTVSFGLVDFQARAAKLGVELNASSLILFGGPAPGAKAMSNAPILGLNAFCQKFLVWQDDAGKVYLSFNDLLALADQHGLPKSIPLRVINFRLNKVFTEALEG